MSARVADGDFRLRHHCAAVCHRYHRVVRATDHLRVAVAMNATVHRLVMGDLHAAGVKNEETRHLLVDVMNGVMRRLLVDGPPVADVMSAARHRVNADPMRAPADAQTFDLMQIRTAVFSHAHLILHSLCSCVPCPTAHHF